MVDNNLKQVRVKGGSTGDDANHLDPSITTAIKAQVDSIGDEFLMLEKYVNLNFTGFHKILKKHDKNLPNKCKAFYVGRMHAQKWVRGDYSDIVVRLSALYALLRGDHKAKEVEGGAQSFMRSTTKYWVNTEDVSKVKYVQERRELTHQNERCTSEESMSH